MKISRKVSLFLFLVVCFSFFISQPRSVKASQVNEPYIIEIGIKRISPFERYIFVNGLSAGGTEVLVYVDGVFSGAAQVDKDGTTNFYFQTKENINEGEHEVMIIARDKKTLVLSVPIQKKVVVSPLPAPTLIKPDKNDAIGRPKPFITGLSVSGTFVHVYIDGVYNGKTEIITDESGTANFAYLPFLNLEKGEHKVWAVAEDETGRKSGTSNTLIFNIEDPMPAPTMFEPVVNNATVSSRPFIVGLAKNDSLIKVFVDNKYDGQFLVENHESGTANFAYKLSKYLTNGKHQVYTTATDSRGKESIWSNMISFQIPQKILDISSNSKTEEKFNETNQEVLGEKIKKAELTTTVVDSSEGGQSEEADTPEILNEKNAGVLGNKQEQSDKEDKKFEVKPELIIFIVFVAGVIAWIIWVNRELVKEKKVQAEKDKEKNDVEQDAEENKNDSK